MSAEELRLGPAKIYMAVSWPRESAADFQSTLTFLVMGAKGSGWGFRLSLAGGKGVHSIVTLKQVAL
jgi:hypothetical protein